MRKFIKILLASAFLFSSFIYAETLKEGQDYITLKTPIANADNSVIEIFSYGCIHCYNHYKFGTLQKLKKDLPKLDYQMFHTTFGQGYEKEMYGLFAYAKAQDAKNNLNAGDKDSLVEKLAGAYFASHFEKKQRENLDNIYKIGLETLGITRADLDNFLKTKEAQEQIKVYSVAEEISKTHGTPAFIVNGKYQILPGAFDSFEVLEVIVEELQKKH